MQLHDDCNLCHSLNSKSYNAASTAEASAIKEGILLAAEYPWSKIMLESDSQVVCRSLASSAAAPWDVQQAIQEIKDKIASLTKVVQVKWIGRTINEAANWIAGQ